MSAPPLPQTHSRNRGPTSKGKGKEGTGGEGKGARGGDRTGREGRGREGKGKEGTGKEGRGKEREVRGKGKERGRGGGEGGRCPLTQIHGSAPATTYNNSSLLKQNAEKRADYSTIYFTVSIRINAV